MLNPNYLIYIFYWIIYCTIFTYSFSRINLFEYKRYRIRFYFLFFILLLFSIYNNINADYYNYARFLKEMQVYLYSENVELVYHFIARFLNYENIPFRIIILSVTFLIILHIINKFGKDRKHCLLLFACLYCLSFSTLLRSSLSDAIFYLGVLNYFNKKSLSHFLLMIILVTLALFFHKSTFLLIPGLLISFIPFNRKMCRFIFFLLPFGVIIGTLILNHFSNTEMFENSPYLSGEEIEDKNIRVVVFRIMSDYSSLILALICLYANKVLLNSKDLLYQSLYRYLFVSIIIYMIIFFQPASNYFHERFLAHLSLPILLMLSYMPMLSKSSRMNIACKVCIFILFIACNVGILRRLMDYEEILKRLDF